jgi:alpha-mannosidase
MPPRLNPLPQFIPGRFASLRARLEGSLWEERLDLPVVISPVSDEILTVEQAYELSYQPILPGEYFGQPFGEWQQCWFRVDVPAPQPGQAGRRHFFWDSRGETTVYIDGQPWAGLDVAHLSCILPERACTLWLDCGTYQTCIWADGGKDVDQYGLRFEGAWMACRNLAHWETYWDTVTLSNYLEYLLKRDGLGDVIVPYGRPPELRKVHPVLRKLIFLLDEATQAWETGGIDALGPALKRIFIAFPAEAWQPKISLIGHSHLDLVWMWPEVEGERKAIHTIATALRLLDEYPQYRFMWTSPASMTVLQEKTPALYQEVLGQLHSGRWEATGGAWVEFDTLIACGEALGRSLALGQHAFQQLRGSTSSTLWLPDCFGFNAFLPQIISQAGVNNFYTTKMSWSVVTDFPYDSFCWRSADGSQVVAHLNTKAPSGEGVAAWAESAEHYRQLDVHDEILKSVGVGDGGGGTTVHQIEINSRLGNLAQIPRVEWDSVEGYFERLGQIKERLPVFEGELYLEFHRGCYTTQSEFKRLFRRLETSLQTWEAARVLLGGGSIPEEPWQRLSFTQFHDSIPGSSIQLVYEQLGAELEALGDQALAAAQSELGGTLAGPAAVFNPLALDRRVVVECASPQASAGLQYTRSTDGEAWLASALLKGLSAAPLTEATALGKWEVTPRVLDNGCLRVEFDEQGRLVSANDGRPWPLAGAPSLALHPDTPVLFDAWEIDHTVPRHSLAMLDGVPLKVIESGPVRAVLAGQARLGESETSLEVRYILETGSDVLKIELNVDWRETHRALRFYLPSTLRGRNARYGAPYGSVQRPQVPGSPKDEAMWEVPASRWAAITDDAGQDGLAIVTEAKYGFACRDGELALSLLRAPLDPGSEWPGNPLRHMPDGPAERGQHRIGFALARYSSRTSGGSLSTPALAEALYAPVLAVPATTGAKEAPFKFVSDLETIIPTWVLPSQQGGFILRLNETLGASGSLKIETISPVQVARVGFLEQELDSSCIRRTGPRQFEIDYRPYDLISLRFSPE